MTSRVFEIDSKLALWSMDAEDILSALEEAVDEAQRTRSTLIIWQNSELGDRTACFTREAREGWVAHLELRIRNARKLLAKIWSSSVPIVYGSASSCTGSWWEMALACSERVWFGERSIVGHDRIDDGYYPVCGTLEGLFLKNPRSRNKFLTDFLRTASHAGGWLRYLGGEEGTKEEVKSWVANRYEVGLDISLQGLIQPLKIEKREDTLRTHSFKSAVHGDSLWEECWNLVRKNSFVGSLFASTELCAAQIIRLGSKHTQNRPPIGPVVRRLHLDAWQFREDLNIEVSEQVPPFESLVYLWQAGYRVQLICADEAKLIYTIGKLFSWVEKHHNYLVKHWEKLVDWHPQESSDCQIFMKWKRFGEIELRGERFPDTLSLQTLRLSPKEARWVEVNGESWVQLSDSQQLGMLAIFPKVLVVSYDFEGFLPLKLLSLAYVLSSILTVSEKFKISPSEFMKVLGDSDWTKIVEVGEWEEFFRMFSKYYNSFDKLLSEYNFLNLRPDLKEIFSWKHVNAAVNTVEKSEPECKAEMVAEFSFRLTQLFETLISKGVVHSEPDLDAYLGELCGYPESYGGPLFFLQSHGIRRYQSWQNRERP